MTNKLHLAGLLLIFLGSLTTSCNNDDDNSNVPQSEETIKEKVKDFEIDLSTETEIPAVTGRSETGKVTMTLYKDNSLDVDFDIKNLKDGDVLELAHVHKGDVVSTGDVVIDLLNGGVIKFDKGIAKGTLQLTAEQVTALLGKDIYVNVHSKEVKSGLLRGDIGVEIDKSYNVMASPKFSIPAVEDRAETGVAYFRLIGDQLSFQVSVDKLDSSDQLIAAHIHTGDVVSTGGVLINLLDNGIAFVDGIAKGTLTLTQDQISGYKAGPNYVNVHSDQKQAGLLRGQLGVSISQSYNVAISPQNQVPAISGRSETGTTYLRVVGNTLYYKTTIENLASDDSIAAGHIHEGGTGINGGVFLDLKMTTTDTLDKSLKLENLSTENIEKLKNNALYVNIHTAQAQAGLLRGNIR